MDTYLEEIGKKAKEAEICLRTLATEEKKAGLLSAADRIEKHYQEILRANEKDLEAGKRKGMSAGLLDRLMLSKERILGMAEGLRQIARLEDPVGEMISMKQRPNGLWIGQKRVPLGIVGIIYEARPNVTADAFGLCFLAGNVVILKGGSDALYSNQAVVSAIQEGLRAVNLPETAVQLIERTEREVTEAFMKMNDVLDVLIPRGGANLIRTVVRESTVPVIETGVGNCHIYVDASADLEKAVEIIENAKTQRIGVCNACESLVIHKDVLQSHLPAIAERLREKQVEIRGDERACQTVPFLLPAGEEDWGTEYLDLIISVKTVDSIEEAIAHINRYNTGHSEAILTENFANAEKFLNEIDAAAVYVNASTRFTDGGEFGFGGEIGISTQKLHARGPMGVKALTSTKYIIYGNGQVRS